MEDDPFANNRANAEHHNDMPAAETSSSPKDLVAMLGHGQDVLEAYGEYRPEPNMWTLDGRVAGTHRHNLPDELVQELLKRTQPRSRLANARAYIEASPFKQEKGGAGVFPASVALVLQYELVGTGQPPLEVLEIFSVSQDFASRQITADRICEYSREGQRYSLSKLAPVPSVDTGELLVNPTRAEEALVDFDDLSRPLLDEESGALGGALQWVEDRYT